MNNNTLGPSLIAVSCLAMTLVGTVEAKTTLEEIVVTAQKREQSQKDVPISMSVFDDNWIKKNTIGTFQDLTLRVPNLSTTSVPGTDKISIRGIGSGNNAGFEQSVATFVDGVYRSRSKGIQLALFDLERIEILKGPQVTYFGNNAIAGALSATTRKPEPGEDLTYNVNASYSWDDGEYIVEGGVSSSLTETLSGRIAVKTYGMDGYVYNEFLDEDEPNLDQYSIRVSLAWQPTDSWRSDFRLDYGRERSSGVTPAELIECPSTFLPPAVAAAVLFSPVNVCARYLNANGGVVDDNLDYVGAHDTTYLDFDQYEAVLTNSWDISDKSRLTSVTSFTDHELDTLLELTPVAVLNNNGTAHFLPVVPIEESREFAQELRFESSVGDLDYMLGGYYGRSDLDYDLFGGFFFLEPVSGMSLVSLNPHEQETDTYSAFGSATYHVSTDFRLSAGLRYLRSEKEAHRSGAIGVGTSGVPSHDSFVPLPLGVQLGLSPVLGIDLGDYADPTHSDSGLMTSVDLQYDFNDETMVFLKYSRGFKAGGFSFAPQEGNFEKEKVNAYEMGIKTFLFDRSVSLDVVAYLSEYTDFQEAFNKALPTGAAILVVENVGEATSKGVEVSVAWQATNSLKLFADLAYLDAKYDSFPDAQCDSITTALAGSAFGCVADLSGRERPFAPDFSGNLGMNFTYPVQGDRAIRFDSLVYFRSEYYTMGTLDPLSLEDGWTKVDVSLSYGAQDESWEVGLFGKNLTDELTCGRRNTVPAAPGTAFCVVERGRAFGIKFSMQY